MAALTVSSVNPIIRGALTHATTALLVVSVLFNVMLARDAGCGGVKSLGPTPGTSVPALEGVDADGRQASFDFLGGRPTVIYYFSPTCAWCERNQQNILSLRRDVAGRFRFIGISTERPTSEFMRDHGYDFPVYSGVSENIRRALKLGGTPQTFVVSAGSRLDQAWVGAYVPGVGQEIERYFGVTLPGLVDRGK